MQAKSLREALTRGVMFIALNDDPDVLNVRTIAGTLSVVALSEAFGVSAKALAQSIVNIRKSTQR